MTRDGTFAFADAAFKRDYWWPNPDSLTGSSMKWRPIYPEICEIRAAAKPECTGSGHSQKCKAPGFKSKRVALVFRGDAFRGLSYGVTVKYCKNRQGKGCVAECNKRPFYCTSEATAVQRATAKAQLKLMVDPLEKAGLAVDIYLSSYGCTGLAHVSQGTAKQRAAELVEMYGGSARVKAHQVFDRDPGGDGSEGKGGTEGESEVEVSQDTGVHQAMRLLLNATGGSVDYEAVLLWRYDVVPRTPMGPPEAAAKKLPFKDMEEIDAWKNYALMAPEWLIWFDGEWASKRVSKRVNE